MFIEFIQKNYTISLDFWYTERKCANDGKEFEIDTGSAQHVNSLRYLLAAHRTHNRKEVPNIIEKIAFFDNVKE